MQTNCRKLVVVMVLGASAFTAQAQVSKAGLREVTTKLGSIAGMDKAMAQMQQQMASMPPERRKQIEAMLAKQGMSTTGAPGGVMSKLCIAKDMVERSQMPVKKTRGDCTSTTSNKSNTGVTFKFICASPPSSGEGQYTLIGHSAYTMKMKINTPFKPVMASMIKPMVMCK